ATMRERLANGWRILVTTAGTGSAHRIVERCGDADVPARVEESWSGEASVVAVVPHVTGARFEAPESKLWVVNESDFTGRAVQAAGPMVRVASRRRNHVDPLQLRPGDFVVHEQHGVGRFVELVT